MFNHRLQVKERRERENGIERYSSTKALLVDDMEVVGNVKYANAQAAFDVWLGWIARTLHLQDSATEVVSKP